jgi:hypothetical protein
MRKQWCKLFVGRAATDVCDAEEIALCEGGVEVQRVSYAFVEIVVLRLGVLCVCTMLDALVSVATTKHFIKNLQKMRTKQFNNLFFYIKTFDSNE